MRQIKVLSGVKDNKIIRKIGSIIPKGKFGRDVTILAGGAMLGQCVTLAVSPIITRLYTPGDFGILAVYASIISVVYVIASWRYELAMPLPEDDKTGINVAALSAILVLITSVLSGVIIAFFGSHLISWIKIRMFSQYLWLLPVGIFMSGSYQVLNFWAVRRGSFRTISKTKFSQSFSQAMTQVGLGILGVGPMGLLSGDIIGRFGGSGTLLAKFLKEDKHLLSNVTVQGVKQVAARYIKFPLFSGSSALLNSAATQLPAILLAGFFGPATAGWFALGQRVVTAPLSFVSLSVSQVYMNEASRLARENPEEFKKLFMKTARQLFVVGFFPIIALAIGGPWLFSIIFGTSWSNAGVFLRILSIMLVFQFVSSPISYTLDILERMSWELVWNALRLVLSIGGLAATYFLGYSASMAIAVYSTIMAVVYIVLLLISYIAVLKHVDNNKKRQSDKSITDCA